MTSYRQTAYNDFETPSGAVGEAPDGPGAFQHVMDQVDGRLGIGGAEYCANPTARDAIPSSRLFVGKMAYVASEDTSYRYNGSVWVAWSSPWKTWTPTMAGLTVGNGTWSAAYRYIGGAIHASANFTIGSTSAFTGSVVVDLPVPGVNYTGIFTTQIIIGGNLYQSFSQQTVAGGTSVRIRAGAVSGSAVRLNDISATFPAIWGVGDTFEFHGLYRV